MTNPFPILSSLSYRGLYDRATAYRAELSRADNSKADLDPQSSALRVQYDETVLTAKLGRGSDYETRHQGKDGVTLTLVETAWTDRVTVTSLTKGTDGAYSGVRADGYSTYYNGNNVVALSGQEAEFLFALREPPLKPQTGTQTPQA